MICLPSHIPPLCSDEKWFYGLVARTFAKACKSLGIQKQTFSCQHKSHTKKVDVLAFSCIPTQTYSVRDKALFFCKGDGAWHGRILFYQ
jgi:hypothetical protein